MPPRKTRLRSNPKTAREWERRSRKKLPAKSERRREVDRKRAGLKAMLLIDAGLVRMPNYGSHDPLLARACAAVPLGVPGGCSSFDRGRPVLEMHEVVKRSRWARGVTVRDNCVLLCQKHHDWTEAEIDAATAVGLLRSAGNVDPFDKFDTYDPEGD
jgi:hypothetical protein